MRKLLGLGVLLFVFAGCGGIEDGTVTGKDFRPAWSEEVLEFHQIGDIQIPVWETVNYPDSWSVTYKKYNEKSREWDFRTRSVAKETYDAFAEGDYIDFRPRK